MLAERGRLLRLLAERRFWALWLGRFIGQTAEWLFLFILLLAAWALNGDPAVVGWVVAARFVPRALIAALPGFRLPRGMRIVVPILLAAEAVVATWVAVVIWFPTDVIGSPALWMLIGAVVVGTLATLANNAEQGLMLKRVARRSAGASVLLWAVIDRAGMLAGAVAAAVLMRAQVETRVLALLIGLGFVVAAVLVLIGLLATDSPATQRTQPEPQKSAGQKSANLIGVRWLPPYATAFGGGALATAVLAALFILWSGDDTTSAQPLLLAAVVGAGMLLGPIPVPRVLLRVSAPLVSVAAAAVLALAAVAAFLSGTLLVAIPALFLFGVAAVTQDSVRAISIRRLAAPESYRRVARGSVLALALGQVTGAAAIALGSAALDPTGTVIALAVGQLLLVGVALLIGGPRAALKVGGLSSLPVKSVVHELSWDTRPAATPADFTAREPRTRRLAKWINRQVEMERLMVTLPLSRREFEIYRPNEQSRERLFEQGRADPDKQMPYWAKVWPSGVALADVVVERNSEVSDKHVLELGAGLGVTACAVLEYGGHIVTADYSALPLAHCRLNAVVNTGRSPGATCFNWRHDAEVAAVTAQADFANGFPLIIAGDVLYEGRDAEPLLNVIDRLLVDEGSLWLAEPVRRTAQRFLDSAAALGWEIESRQVKADWPDATDGPVNLHFLTRSPEADRIVGDLGGWRI